MATALLAAFARHGERSGLPRALLAALQHARAHSSKKTGGEQWIWMQQTGHRINPCNSQLHPAVIEAGLPPEGDTERSVQDAYTPDSACWGCGPAADADGLHLRSYRIPGGLQATLQVPAKYQAFPGILNGGVISTLFDCHGNWTAAIALMDRTYLPRPPLTLTYELLVTYKEPTPPDQPLIVRSQVVKVRDANVVGSGKATVQVDMSLHLGQPGGREKLLATGTGIYKKLGALRAL